MRKTVATAMILAATGTAASAQTVTVQSLLAQEFAVVGTIASPAGPGIFLQKKDKLFLCFVSETPTSAAVATRYCKPVQ
jgi:hypothetical protein